MPLERVELGRTGLRVTRLGFGSSSMGGLYAPTPAAQARATAERAWELGVRLFDTAPHYGAGLAEQRLGQVLAGRPRGDLVLSTKVGRRLLEDDSAPDQADGFFGTPRARRVWDFSRDGIRRCVEESLERMGLARADVLLLHDPEDHLREALEDGFPALAEMRGEGLASAVGVGSGSVPALERFVAETDLDCVLVAGRLTLLDASAAATLLPTCRQRGIGVICAGVFNSGILANPASADARYNYAGAAQPVRARAQVIAEACAAYGVPIAAAALRFPFLNPATHAVLVGARSPEEIEEDLALAAIPIPAELWSELAARELMPPTVAARVVPQQR